MPFIDCKISKRLADEQKERLKCALGSAITAMHKPESYLMIGIADGYDLWLGGKKLNDGAFVDIRAFGGVTRADCEKMTAAVCSALSSCASISAEGVYITYQGYENWGWNGGNF